MSELDAMLKELHEMAIADTVRKLNQSGLTIENAQNLLKRRTVPDLKEVAAILGVRVGKKRRQEIVDSIIEIIFGRVSTNG